MNVSSSSQIWMGAIWRRTETSIVYRMNPFIPILLRNILKIAKKKSLRFAAFSQPPKSNYVLTYAVVRPTFWVARITTAASNPRLEHITSRIRTFPGHFLCWWNCTYLFASFCMEKCIFWKKNIATWAHVGTKFLNLSHHVLSYRWLACWCDFLSCGANLFFPPHLFLHEVQLSLLTVLYWPVSRCALGRT